MKANILRQHGIKPIELENGTILADNEDGTFENVSKMSLANLYLYLGY
jgi:hypothetical protein